MPSRLSTLRSAKRGNNSASTPKPKPIPKVPSISSQRKTVIQRRKKQITKNLLDRKFDEQFQLKYRGDKDYSKRHAVEQRKRPLKKRKVCKTKKREKERKKEGTIDI